mmetsp:Transcript_13465/g.19935  ORF Transcript_13465/g.19935 Transcript_13465/m.19935 type:complete len:138 (-) Transcript_13465:2428-2841(-)
MNVTKCERISNIHSSVNPAYIYIAEPKIMDTKTPIESKFLSPNLHLQHYMYSSCNTSPCIYMKCVSVSVTIKIRIKAQELVLSITLRTHSSRTPKSMLESAFDIPTRSQKRRNAAGSTPHCCIPDRVGIRGSSNPVT